MSERNERESYPYRNNQGRRPEQDNYSNAVTLICIIVLLLIIVGNGLLKAYYPELFNLN